MNDTILFSEAAAEQIWLQYFNDTLFSRGIITEQERNRMSAAIGQKKPGRVSHRRTAAGQSPASEYSEQIKEETL